VSLESRMIVLQQANERRYTDEDQKSEYPDDRGLEFVAAANTTEDIIWGIAS
jgi:hypothetical protein